MTGAQGTLAVAQARGAVAERMSGPAGLRRLQSDDQAADRGLVQARAGDARRASRVRVRTCWAAGRRWPTSACGASSTRRRPIRRRARMMRASAPNVMAWVERMTSPKAEGPFESWSSLSARLMPLLTDEVGRLVPAVVGRQRGGDRRRATRASRGPSAARPGRRSRRSITPARLPEIRRKYEPAKARARPRRYPGEAGCLSALRGAAALACVEVRSASTSDDAISVRPDRPSSTITRRRNCASLMRP